MDEKSKRLLRLEALFNKHKVDKSELTKYGLSLGDFLRAVKEYEELSPHSGGEKEKEKYCGNCACSRGYNPHGVPNYKCDCGYVFDLPPTPKGV